MQIQRNGMGYVSKKNKEIIVLCRINLLGEGVATLLKMGLRGILVCYFVKIETVFGCRNSNNLLIHQDLFFKKVNFFYNLNHFIARAPYASYNQMRPL